MGIRDIIVNRITILALLSGFALVGCNAAGVQSDQSVGQAPAPASVTIPATDFDQAAQFEQLNGRITLLQEQFLELKVQNSAVAERLQLLLTQFQVLAQAVKKPPEASKAPAADTSELMRRLDQQLVELQQLAPELGGGDPFKLATCYTAKGQWVLIRYNRFSGESWISATNSWKPLAEELTPSISSYEVQLLPAKGDVKGYVAARVDQNSGETWWLNRNAWVKYQQ